MNFGNTFKKLAAELHLALRIHKPLEAIKPNFYPGVSDVLKWNSKKSQNLMLKNTLDTNQGEKFFYIVPKRDLGNIKEIIEPVQRKKVHVELPLRNVRDKALDLPCNIRKEIVEPVGRIISKKAFNIIKIRRRKMRKHKHKKYHKKNRFELAKKLQKRALRREFNYQTELKAILKESETFSAENHVNEVLKKVNWVRPVTKVRGLVAPPLVINQHLEEKREKKELRERIKEITGLMKGC